MIIALDTETRGLDATKFVRGCIVKENTKKPRESRPFYIWGALLHFW